MVGARCEACGMSLEEETRIYCEHCAKDEAGQELGVSQEEAFEGIKKHYFMETMGLGEEEARKKLKSISKLCRPGKIVNNFKINF